MHGDKEGVVVKVLAISGSLRAASLNTAMLRALMHIAPSDIDIEMSPSIGELPLFNPDIEYPSPTAVVGFRQKIIAADALIIASPEYAHGVTGAMKNALDWMVGNESFVNKPVAVFNASPRASHAHGALIETLSVMSAHIVTNACVVLPIVGFGLTEVDVVAHPEISDTVRSALTALREAVDRIV